jgi:hypothetical protein
MCPSQSIPIVVMTPPHHSIATACAYSPGSARKPAITKSEESPCLLTATCAIRQSVPRRRPSNGRLTLSWVSFSRHLPSCLVRSAGHRALCAASQAQNGRLASVYASRSRELQRQDERSETTSHKDDQQRSCAKAPVRTMAATGIADRRPWHGPALKCQTRGTDARRRGPGQDTLRTPVLLSHRFLRPR